MTFGQNLFLVDKKTRGDYLAKIGYAKHYGAPKYVTNKVIYGKRNILACIKNMLDAIPIYSFLFYN